MCYFIYLEGIFDKNEDYGIFSFPISLFFDKYIITGGRTISKGIVEAGLIKMEMSSKKI